MIALIRAELLSRWRMLAGLAIGTFAFLLIMASTYRSLGIGLLGTSMTTHTPKAISALSGTAGANLLTPSGWLGFGFAHPMFLLLSCTVAIAIPAASIAGAVESGRAEMLFVRPRSRRRFLAAAVAVWAASQLIVAASGFVGAVVGGRLDPDIARLGVAHELTAVLQSLTLFTFVAATGFVASARLRTRGSAAGVAIAATAGFYLLNFVSTLVDGLAWVRWLTPFGYYQPVSALGGGFEFGHAAALLAAAAAMLAVAAALLERRDLG